MKNNKFITFVFSVFIIIAFIIIGYRIYESYDSQKKANNKNVEINNYYSVDYLFNNGFIKNANTISDFSNEGKDLYMYLDAENVFYIKSSSNDKKVDKQVTGLPKTKTVVYYNNLYDDYYEFVAKTDNDIYYTCINITDNNDRYFTKVGSNIKNVYIPAYDKQSVYVNQNNSIITNFIFLDENRNFKYLSSENNNYVLKDDLESKKPFYDYVCASSESSICNDLMIYQTFKNEVSSSFMKDVLKEEEKPVEVKDMFSIFEIKSDNNIDMKTLKGQDLQKYDFVFDTYVIDINNNCYKIEITSKVYKEKQNAIVTKLDYKVKEIKYNDNSFEIIYDGIKRDIITKDKNKILTTSTIYDKKNGK